MGERSLGRSDVGVVLVGYRSGPSLLERADALKRAGFTVSVVDNAGEHEREDVLVPGQNLGFGGACNLGVANLPATVSVVVLHNPDVLAPPEAIDRLVGELLAQPVPGVVSASEFVPGEGVRRGYRMPLPRRELVLGLAARSPRWAAVAGRLRQMLGGRSGTSSSTEQRFGSGALMVLDRARFELVGGFDERYFLYAEDLDLWDRIARSGANAAISVEAVVHDVGTGSEASRSRRELLRWLGVELYFEDRPACGRWAGARLAHRTALWLAGGPTDDVERAVLANWRAGVMPSQVQAFVRPLLADSQAQLSEGLPGGVDVVVTCHDYGNFLAEAVESVESQTRPPASVVIVDDASSDETPEVVAALLARGSEIRAIRNGHRSGVAASRNSGMAIGNAPYVCFLDADDRMPPDYLERLVDALEAGADIAFAPLRAFGPGAADVRSVSGYDADDQVVDNLINASAVFRRELVARSGGVASSLDVLGYEDWDFWLRMVQAGARVRFVDETWLEYRRHGEGSRNDGPGFRRLFARIVVWWRSRRVVRARHVRRWLGPALARRVVRWR